MVTGTLSEEGAGGAERFCEDLSRRVADEGFDVGILTSSCSRSGGPTPPLCNVSVFDSLVRIQNKIGRKLMYDYYQPWNVRVLRGLISRLNPDIIHFHNVYGVGSNLIRESSTSVPTVVTVHDYWPLCFRSTMMRRGVACRMDCWRCRFPIASLTRLLKKFQIDGSILVAPSNFMASMLLKGGFRNVRTIFNATKLPGRISEGLSERRLLYVGRIVPEKGVELACQAAEYLRVPLAVVGTGTLLSELKNNYADSRWITFKGYVQDLSSEFERGGVLVIPSLWPENQPIVPLEAMARGVPVVGSKVGGIPEIVEDGYNGRLFEPGNLEELVDSIEYCLSEGNYPRLSQNCLTTIMSKFDWSRTTRQYLQLYRELVN